MGGRGAGSGGGLNPYRQQSYSAPQRAALHEYTASSHINKEIADSDKYGFPMPKYYADKQKLMDSAIKKNTFNPFNGDLYRGGGGIIIGIPDAVSMSTQEIVDYINTNLMGVTTVNVAYSSTTTELSTARAFASGKPNPVVLHLIDGGDGLHGAAVSGQGGSTPISQFGTYEHEIVLERRIGYTPVTPAFVGIDGYAHVGVRISKK